MTVRAPYPRLLLVSGSQRKESFNGRLLRNIGGRLRGRCQVDLLGAGDVDLPLFNQDLESDPAVIRRIAALHGRFESGDGLIVSTPEYNGQLPPYLKNMVDWVSRLAYIDPMFANPFVDRPLLLCTASTGFSGGALAVSHARALFGYVGCVVIGDTVCVPHVAEAWTGDGYDFRPSLDRQIDDALGRVLYLASAFAARIATVDEPATGLRLAERV